jgi:hypothetical protein
MRRAVALAVQLAVCGAIAAPPCIASAIPAFARKYGTSCLTCHVVYPKLNPFGEAFRRNGYLFPGIDSDYVKQDTVALGQAAAKKTFPNSVWPDSIPISVPLSIGANGQVVGYPDKNASVPRANNGTQFVLDNLVAEAHIWAGAAFNDNDTVWAEVTFSGGGADVEHAQLLFNNLVGPKHAVNFVVGRGFPTLTSFGPHSTFLADIIIPTAPVTGIFGTLGTAGFVPVSGDPFVLIDNFTGLELNGVVGGWFDYSAGLNAGKNAFGGFFNSETWYAHAGYKIGGMRLDGEGSQGPKNPMKPWAEDAVTLDLYGVHTREHFPNPTTGGVGPAGDTQYTLGVHGRGQLGSGELNVGYYAQHHEQATAALAKVWANVAYGELTYVVYPWLVPGVRVEWIGLRPGGAPNVSDVHIMPGIAFLIRANIKAILVANIESGSGFPADPAGNPLSWMGGSADWGPFVLAPKPTSTPTSSLAEFESLALYLAWAM